MLRSLLRTADLTADDVTLLLDLSTTFKSDPLCHHTALQGQSVVQYLAKPSTRTRISNETAVARLGGVAITTGPSDLQIGRGETIEDTARTISQFAAAFLIRTFHDADVQRFAAASSIPVVNALTDGHHPCQSIADLLTLRDRFGQLQGLTVAYVGDGYNVAHSLMEACALMGIVIRVATPPGYEPSQEVQARAAALAATSGGRVTVTHDPVEAVRGANAVYTDVWFSMGDSELERASRVGTFSPYRIDTALMSHADPAAIFLHCLPAHRGEEVMGDVIDGPQSTVFEQAANRLPTAQAIIYALVMRQLEGTAS